MRAIPAALFFTIATALAQSPLTTTFVSNGGGAVGGAVFFDLTVITPVTLTGIDVNLGQPVGTAGRIDVLTTPGSFTSATSTSSPWTARATGCAVRAAGIDVPSPCALPGPFSLAPGNYGVCVIYHGVSARYTNGAATFPTAELSMSTGAAQNVPFGGTVFTPRTWNGSLHYQAFTGTVCRATTFPYGASCGSACSVYESFAPGAVDLAGQRLVLTPNSAGGYDLTNGGAATITPPSTPPLALSAGTAVTLPLPFAFPRACIGGTTNSIVVDASGRIGLVASMAPDPTPTVAELLLREPVLCPLWANWSPSPFGGVHFDTVGGTQASVTWNNVAAFGGGATARFQVVMFASGVVEFRYQTAPNAGNALVGFSGGGGAIDPGAVDLSAIPVLSTTREVTAPSLSVAGRPIVAAVPTDVTFVLRDVPVASTTFALTYLSFAAPVSPLSLAALGAPGCSQHILPPANPGPAFPLPLTTTSTSLPLRIPPVPALVCLRVFGQALLLAPGLNPAGVLTTNGVDVLLGL